MRTIGIVLAIAGVIALIYGGFEYTRHRDVLHLGSLEVTASEHKTFPIPAAAGALVLAGGIVLLVTGARRGRTG